MDTEYSKIGDTVRHVDGPADATGTLVRYYAGWDVVVRWDSTGRESTENIGLLETV